MILTQLVLSLLVGAAHAQDMPDEDLENRFHHIYQSYNSEPTSESAWEIASGKSQSRKYQIQNGDTLWDISRTLFGDPHFWPKVWSINGEQILNPHEIEKGGTLQFEPGTATEAPTLKMTDSTTPDPSAEVFPDKVVLQIPPPAKEYPPPAEIPASFPSWAYQKDKDVVIKMELESVEKRFHSDESLLPYKISTGSLNGMAKVIETRAGNKTSADFQEIYVQFQSEPKEKIWHFFKQEFDLRDKFKNKKVVVIQNMAEAELKEPVNRAQHIYRMVVKRTVNPLMTGAMGLPGPLPRYVPEGGNLGKDISARIIGGQDGTKRKLFGAQSLIYLNVGAQDGVQVGDIMDVRRRPDRKGKFGFLNENLEALGKLKIVDVDANYSTAYVLETRDDLRVGDQTGSVLAQ